MDFGERAQAHRRLLVNWHAVEDLIADCEAMIHGNAFIHRQEILPHLFERGIADDTLAGLSHKSLSRRRRCRPRFGWN